MSDLKKKAEEYAALVENYKKSSINPVELDRYHSLAEQNFDIITSELEESLQDDIQSMPIIVNTFKKISQSFNEIIK